MGQSTKQLSWTLQRSQCGEKNKTNAKRSRMGALQT